MGAVAASGVGDWDEDEFGVGHLCDQLFCDAQLRWVDEVIGGVDPKDWGGDGGEFWRGVVVARGVDVVDEVVGIGVRDVGGDGFVDVGFDLSSRWVVLLELEGSAAGEDEEIHCAAEAFDGWASVAAVVPCGIVLDVFDGHVAPHAVAAGEFDGEAGEGCEGVGELGVGFAPHEGLHAAHGGAKDEAEVIDVEAFGEHGVLGRDHVVIVVLGELHAEAVGGFGGLAVADVIGEDEEILCDVEGLARAEEHVGEDGVEE